MAATSSEEFGGFPKCIKVDDENIQDILATVNLVLLGFEGVITWDDKILPGAKRLLKKLHILEKEIWVFSNKSNLSRDMIVSKLNSCGIKLITKSNVICSTFTTGYSLKNFMNFYGKILCCGSDGLKNELEQNDLECITIPSKHESQQSLVDYKIDPMVNCVVVGLDEEFTYSMGAKCCKYLAKTFMPLLLTDDVKYPHNKNIAKTIDTSGIYKMFSLALKKNPDYVIGMPEKFMLKVLSSLTEFDSTQVLLITDRIMPDIFFANRCGFHSLLVFNGLSDIKQMKQIEESTDPIDAYLQAEFYSNSIDDFQKLIDVDLSQDSEDEEDEEIRKELIMKSWKPLLSRLTFVPSRTMSKFCHKQSNREM